jgi:hypothetical protein
MVIATNNRQNPQYLSLCMNRYRAVLWTVHVAFCRTVSICVSSDSITRWTWKSLFEVMQRTQAQTSKEYVDKTGLHPDSLKDRLHNST